MTKFFLKLFLKVKTIYSRVILSFSNNENKKSFFNKAKLIISKTISVKSLPDEIIKFQSNPYIRLLRVLNQN